METFKLLAKAFGFGALIVGVVLLIVLGGVALFSNNESNVVSESEVTEHTFPSGVHCYVYNSHDDSGSGISCVRVEG